MPWRGPEYPGEFPTLGYVVAEWMQEMCVIPDRAVAGQPYMLSREQLEHLVWQFRLHADAVYDVDKPAAPFVYDGSLIVRSQKWGKGPLSSARIAAQAVGPVLFGGWDANGEPVGIPWATPHIQVAAVAEDQTENIWRALKPMVELGPLADVIEDTGLGHMRLANGGLIERVSSRALTRLGARITYVEIDQPESMTRANGGERLVDTLLRNNAGMGGRWAATGNAHDPTERSVQQTWIDRPLPNVYIDYPEPPPGSWTNKRDRRRILRHAYKGSPWVDLDRVEADCDRLEAKGDPGQAERFFGNRVVAGNAKAFNTERWRKPVADGGLFRPDYFPSDGALLALGIDGARFQDALAIVATEVLTGFQWPVGIWERPERAEPSYEHPADVIDDAMVNVFERFNVWRAYVDPQHIEHLVEKWQGRWGARRIVPWFTNRDKQAAWAVKSYIDAQAAGDVTNDGDDDHARHMENAVKVKVNVYDDQHNQLHSINKDGQNSPRKMDGAWAGVLSWKCRGDAIAADAGNEPSNELEETPQRPGSGTSPTVTRGDLVLRGEQYIDRDDDDYYEPYRRGR